MTTEAAIARFREKHAAARRRLADAEKRAQEAANGEITAAKAREFCTTHALAVQSRVHQVIAGLVTRCLHAVFQTEEWINVQRSSLPKTIVPGISKIPGRDGRIILEMEETWGLDSEEGEQSRRGNSLPNDKRSKRKKMSPSGQSGSESVRRRTSSRNGVLSRSGLESDQQQTDQPSMGDPQREHERPEKTQKKYLQNNSGRSQLHSEDTQDRKIHSSKLRRRIRNNSSDSSRPTDQQNLVRVKVMQPAYDFRIEFVKRRNKTEADLYFERDGNRYEYGQVGGGVLDVAAFALRLASLVLRRPPVRKVLVLDEPAKMLSEKGGNLERFRDLLETLANETGFQFIIVSHNPKLEIGKVVRL